MFRLRFGYYRLKRRLTPRPSMAAREFLPGVVALRDFAEDLELALAKSRAERILIRARRVVKEAEILARTTGNDSPLNDPDVQKLKGALHG